MPMCWNSVRLESKGTDMKHWCWRILGNCNMNFLNKRLPVKWSVLQINQSINYLITTYFSQSWKPASTKYMWDLRFSQWWIWRNWNVIPTVDYLEEGCSRFLPNNSAHSANHMASYTRLTFKQILLQKKK